MMKLPQNAYPCWSCNFCKLLLGNKNRFLSVLLHNHSSGDPTPSAADVQMTEQIVDIAKPLGIAIHDHIIVGHNGHASLKGLKLI